MPLPRRSSPKVPGVRVQTTGSTTAPTPCLPRVLIVDLDHTLIGDVACYACEYEILSTLDTARHKEAMHRFAAAAADRIKYGTVRPHVAAFFQGIAAQKRQRGCSSSSASVSGASKAAGSLKKCAVSCPAAASKMEVFIYTASTAGWANIIVPCLEEAIGFTFRRPIFTRDDCDLDVGGIAGGGRSTQFRKSLARVLPRVVRALHPQYPQLKSPDQLIDTDRVLIIENTRSFVPADEARMILCPDYIHYQVYDVLGQLMTSDIMTMMSNLESVLSVHGLFRYRDYRDTRTRTHRHGQGHVHGYHDGKDKDQGPRLGVDKILTHPLDSFMSKYYSGLLHEIKASKLRNVRLSQKNDRFWLRLRALLLPQTISDESKRRAGQRSADRYHTWSTDVVKRLQSKVWPTRSTTSAGAGTRTGGV